MRPGSPRRAGPPAVSATRTRPARGAAGFAKLRGVWRSHGYGTLLEIGPGGYRLHEETRISCLCAYEGSLEELARFYVDLRVSPGRQAFSARRATGVTRVKYRRLKAMPRGRAAADPSIRRDPVHNFDVFWHTFAERYALFELRGVDWQACHDLHRPDVDEATRPERLFAVFVDMLRPLRDGHVELRSSLGHFNAGLPARPQQRLATRLAKRSSDPALPALLADLASRSRDTVRARYLGARVRSACHGLLEWGRLDGATGYLAVHAMAGLCGAANRPREDQQAAATAMDRAMRDLCDLPFLVVDVRRNPGGWDGVALRLAGHLVDRKRLAFTKAASRGGGYSGRQAIHIEPRGRLRYGGRLFLLTSGLTVSAAEVFVLALLQHPRLIRVGEPTHGELSDVMERHLPNGWTIHLSNELYRAADGELYEDRGIPPDVELPFLAPGDVEAGRDPMLDWVLASHGSGS